jgi:hypothetical protein
MLPLDEKGPMGIKYYSKEGATSLLETLHHERKEKSPWQNLI